MNPKKTPKKCFKLRQSRLICYLSSVDLNQTRNIQDLCSKTKLIKQNLKLSFVFKETTLRRNLLQNVKEA